MPVSRNDGRIFGVGLSRTGTSSLTEALQLLNIKAIHYPHDPDSYRQLRAGQFRLSVLDVFDAVTDIPIATFFAELDEAFPGSKFILTVRDIDDWVRSTRRHWQKPLQHADANARAFAEYASIVTFGTVDFSEARFRRVYQSHATSVRKYFADRPDDLLEINICAGDGWEKLCPFLGIDVPESVFPRLNASVHSPSMTTTEDWSGRTDVVVQQVERLVPKGERFCLIDEGKLSIDHVLGRDTVPFPERKGYYWGPPEDNETCIRELKRINDQGVSHVIVAWTAFWWLEYYEEFAQYLRLRYKEVVRDKDLIAFELMHGEANKN